MSRQLSGAKRLDFLDVARGGAALLVLIEHGLHHCVPGYLAFSKANIVVGQAGILVFFMISGFLIPKSLEEGQSNAGFWVRRFFRLFPVYWFSIAVAFAYLALGGPLLLNLSASDGRAWLANTLLLQKWLGHPNAWDVYWSLHYEVGFYVLCSGLFAFGLLHRIGPRTIAALLIGFALACAVGYRLLGKAPGDGDLRLVVLAALFGLVCYRFSAGRIGRGTMYFLLAGTFAAVGTVAVAHAVLHPTAPSSASRSFVLMALGFGSFVLLLEARGRSFPRVALWLGRRSYPIYLLHPFVLIVLAPFGLSGWVFLPVLVALTLLAAEIVHRTVERPGIALGRAVLARGPRGPAKGDEPTAPLAFPVPASSPARRGA